MIYIYIHYTHHHTPMAMLIIGDNDDESVDVEWVSH